YLPASDSSLFLHGLASLASLAALVWPVIRGVPWRQVCWQIGLRAGRQPLLEPFIGLGNYAMALPLLAMGFAVTFVLLLLKASAQTGDPHDNFDVTSLPSHPILPFVVNGGWWVRIQVFFVASVTAPVVEEIMFRGFLYRHLRELTDRLGFLGSVAVSALVA